MLLAYLKLYNLILSTYVYIMLGLTRNFSNWKIIYKKLIISLLSYLKQCCFVVL